MNKIIIFSILILLSLFALYATGLLKITGFFVGFGPPAAEFKWWNTSWHYRFRIEINSTSYERIDWPIEYQVNFTDLLPSGTFDENSTRVIEYSPSGSVLYEVPSQFDKGEEFDSSNNAIGTLIFLMNGTTQQNAKRIFFVYYDKVENGVKQKPNYPTNLAYNWDGEEFNVNNTILSFWVDTIRGENTSGLYRVKGISSGNDIWEIPGLNERTIEYMQYSNGTHNFSFDFRNNATLKHIGAIRIVVEQKGSETVWNSSNVTNEGFVVKRYVFYDKLQWIKIETNFTNIGSNSIDRNSTFAGAIAIDAARAFGSNWQSNFGNTSQPGWWYASDYYSSFHSGIIHFNQSGTNNFWVPNSSSRDRIGIELNSTSISVGSSIIESAVIHFNDTSGDYTQVRDLRDRFANPVTITQFLPEHWYVIISPSTNATIYNRNETVLIIGNVSSGDPYNLTKYMNATLDMGTSSSSDDQTIVLYDDGTHGDVTANDKIFTNTFSIPNDAIVGIWAINYTTYTNEFEFLNSTKLNFNVTDVLNTTVNIQNKKPMVGSIVIANIYVKNYRQDSWISEAMINCSYDSTEVTNKTDYNNGTYSVNFTAPSEEGTYNLYCNATKNGNFGNNTDTFSAELGNTSISVVVQPQNPTVSSVSLYENDSFVIEANASNIGNATAYSTNITLELLNGWSANITLEQCGDLEKNGYCVRSFNITVPNGTSPGNYYINVTATWINPDETISSNKTEVNVTVKSNPKIDVEEEEVSGEAGDGIWSIVGNFTVFSIGNDDLQNIEFSCVSGEVCNNFLVGFVPESISSLSVGSMQNVSVNVSVPLGFTPGTYTGTINVSAQNDGFDTFTLEVYVPLKTNVSITKNISSYTASNITQKNNETFYFTANATNIGNGSARFVNISISIPSGWFAMEVLKECGNLVKSETCQKEFNVTIPEATQPGNYLVNISTNWTQPDNSMGTNKTSITITVASNPLINVSESSVSGTVYDGAEKTVGNFTVLSIGNDVLQNINFNCVSGEVCDNFVIEFVPASISILPANSNQSVMINVTVPLSYPNGTYTGTINVSAQNDGFDTFTLEVYVPENRTWDLYPEYCEKSTQQPEGTACEINVTNKGNTKISFEVFPEEGNYTKVNETSFEIERLSWHVFNITYNVTGVEPGTYNSTFLVNAIQPANPDNKSVRVSLLPYIPPVINVSIIPNETEQNSSVMIFANVTDRSGSGIALVKANITRPDGTVDSFDMLLFETDGSLTRWNLTYSNGTSGSTLKRGIYNVTVYAKDNIGNEDNLNSTFLIYIKLNVLASTLTDKYYQGDSGSIYYSCKDVENNPVENVSVNFTIINSQGNITYISSNLKTNSDGTIVPMPSFSILSDAPLGNYSLVSFSGYKDEIANKTVEKQKNHTFQVLSRTVTVTGLFADVETAVVWYPENIMRFGILVYNGEGKPVDPTSMNLTVYDPANNVYFVAGMNQMTKQATGYYTYQYAMPSNTPSGMFLAVLNVSQNEFQTMKLKAFRVAHGGPYDVRINLLENEVEQGSYLDFILTIENKGEVSQDVFVEYWVSSQNNTYYTASEAVYTPSISNQSFTRSAYIYSNQPLGNYLLNVRVTYDSVQPPIQVNSSFIVIAKVTPGLPPTPTYPTYPYLPIPTGAFPAPAPTEKLLASILISRYNNNISLARGFTRIESVVVNNTGQVDLSNVSLFLLGIPTTWFNITPETYKTLEKENSTVFLITFNIPKNVKVGKYGATLIASSAVVSDQKTITITIFESMEELLREEIKKLKEDLQELQIDVKVAEKEGKDVSSVFLMINEIKLQVNFAEENLENNKTEEALNNISNAKNLIERARNLLSKLEVIRARGFFLPLWTILVIIFFSSISVFIILWRRKVLVLRPWIIPLGKIVDMVKRKKVGKEELINERERLLRMLEVLEKEKDEKIISIGAYREMKKSIEEKLSKIEKKLIKSS